MAAAANPPAIGNGRRTKVSRLGVGVISMKVGLVFVIAAVFTQTYDFGVGGRKVLCAPARDLNAAVLPYADVSTHLQPGHGHTPGVPFQFDGIRSSREIPGYTLNAGFPPDSILNSLSGEIDFVAAAERRKYSPAMRAWDVNEIWNHSRSCPDLKITALPKTGFWYARCRKISQRALLLNRLPEPGIRMPDPDSFVVAICHDEPPIGIGPYKGATDKTCMRTVMIQGFLADYEFQAENAGLVPRLDAFLSKVISRWKNNCRGVPA